MFYTVVLNALYEIESCLLLNDVMFSSCFHVFLNYLFVPQEDVKREAMSLNGFPCSGVLRASPQAIRDLGEIFTMCGVLTDNKANSGCFLFYWGLMLL